MRLSFYGAAREVTGSTHLVESAGQRVLLDCGMHQGRRAEAAQRNANLPFDAPSVSAALLSHAHIDHSGNLPTLVKRGFRGDIHCTPATRDLVNIMLRDSAKIQEQDAEYLNQKTSRRGLPPVEPLYTTADAERTLKYVVGHAYHHWFDVCENVRARFLESGHILGSAICLLELNADGRMIRLGYTGDLGRKNTLILRDPEPAPPLDYLIIESTYGDREHDPIANSIDQLADIVNETIARGGRVIIPAFAVERTQEVIYSLDLKFTAGEIPKVPVFVDSPLAINATEIFRVHPENLRDELQRQVETHDDPFGFGHLQFTRSVEESKAINAMAGPMIVVSANGMADAGRILHHLKHNIENPRNTILFVGYQAENTLGRRLVDGAKRVKIFGDEFRVRAQIKVVNGFSAHADRSELIEWVAGAQANLKGVFIVHGEEKAALSFADALRQLGGFTVTAPERGQTVEVD
ncbi:MAG: MBL fold metallo-hydrolase [Chloroflexi bacterium]|nr:MBL fold metallo-hydrolase [Chloroflexota bacterium]